MNTYALSNCLAPSPEPFVSCKKGQKRKVNTDITFLRRQISVQGNRFWGGTDFHKVKTFMHSVFFPCKHSVNLRLNDHHGGDSQCVSTGNSY